MGAIVALSGSVAIGVDVERIIGARLHTRLATDATLRVKIDNTVRPLVEGLGGTNSDAGGIITVVAAIDEKIAARVGELTFFDILYPRAIDTDGNVMFSFTCNSACMTTDTFTLVNDKGVFHIDCPLDHH